LAPRRAVCSSVMTIGIGNMEMTLALWIIGGLLSTLVMIIGWGVSQMQKKVDSITIQLERMNSTLIGIERDLRGELAGLDRRVSQLQTAMKSLHPEYHGID
jgi:hypothetical protein